MDEDVKEEILVFLDRNGEQPIGEIIRYLNETRGYHDNETIYECINDLEDEQRIREVSYDRFKKVSW